VLKSTRAVQVNTAIMRAFRPTPEVCREPYGEHDRDIGEIFTAIKNLLHRSPIKLKHRIGFKTE
jgi:hypothetical protein